MAQKAKAAILASFLKLAKTNSFEKITVTALVEECGISRQTFYYHFNDIEEMLNWAMKKETDAICSTQVSGKWYDSARLYVPMMEKYDVFFRSALNSGKFLLVFNLLYHSFETFIDSYFALKQPKTKIEDIRFLVDFLSSSYTGLIIKELQKEKSDYDTLVKKIGSGFKVIQH